MQRNDVQRPRWQKIKAHQVPGVEFLSVEPATVFTGRLILRDANKRLARQHIAQLREHRDSLRLHGGDVSMLKGGTSSSYTVSAVFYWR